jgi:hypothetical protein
MSENGGKTPDLSRMISLIMQNPDLIQRIEALAKSDTEAQTQVESIPAEPPREEQAQEIPTVQTAALSHGSRSEKRARLLGAIRPYVSDKRGKTLDTLIGVVDLFDLIGRG